MVYKDKDGVIFYIIKSLRLKEIRNKVKWIMLLGLGGGLKRLQFTIGFIEAWFKALAGIAAIYIFMDVFSKAILSVFPHNHFINIIESILTPYRIIMIPLKNLLL